MLQKENPKDVNNKVTKENPLIGRKLEPTLTANVRRRPPDHQILASRPENTTPTIKENTLSSTRLEHRLRNATTPKSITPVRKPVVESRNVQATLRRTPKATSTTPINTEHRNLAKSTPTLSHSVTPTRTISRVRRPISVNSNITFRRGQKDHQGGGLQGDDLSRASSISNLNAEGKNSNKGALSKIRKSVSKDRLDNVVAEQRKTDKKACNKNNNKIDASESGPEEIEYLQQQLADMSNEKANLALQLGEQRGQLNVLHKEIVKLKMYQENSSLQLDQLNKENHVLRNKLRDVVHSPLSDNEKEQLILDSQRHHHSSSAPASMATNMHDGHSGDSTACPTPDWDKQSSSNVSEVSVACLQDKINQMQETHYSTNEELQATLQELTDLQRQLTELQRDNERLVEEKTLMFESLCRQTERLTDTRSEAESLKHLLYRDKDDTGQFESIVEREQKLVDLLKSSQEEREMLLVKQEQLSSELQEMRGMHVQREKENMQMADRVRALESTLDAKHAEHKQLDQELARAKDKSSSRQIEINRLTDLLDNARTKILELEQDRTLSDKSELDEMLDNARKEKDLLESEVTHLKEQVARSRNETEKFREQVSVLQEECKVTRNNAKCTQSELEYKVEKITAEKSNVSEQLQRLEEAANELQVQSQCQLEDKRQLSSVLSETQRNMNEVERRNCELDGEVRELKKLRIKENEEWEKFQNDLLTSVRVANDFKTEAQQELQKLVMENKAHRDKIRQLESQIEKFKGPMLTTTVDSDLSSHVSSSPSSGPKTVRALKRVKTNTSSASSSLSKQEAMNLRVLNELYAKIDPKIAFEALTPNEQCVVKLKKSYEDHFERSRVRPLNKRASQVAISKPLLTSVYTNPKLRQIAENRSLPTLEYVFASKSSNDFYKSKSLNDISHLPVENNLQTQRFPSMEHLMTNLTQKDDLIRAKKVFLSNTFIHRASDMSSYQDSVIIADNFQEKEASLNGEGFTYIDEEENSVTIPDNFVYQGKLSVSASNSFRYPEEIYVKHDSITGSFEDDTLSLSDKYHLEECTNSLSQSEPDLLKCTKPNTDIDFLYAQIDLSKPEDQLTKDERYIIRMKRSLARVGRKNTLKKLDFARKNVEISLPTRESVLRNPKLAKIALDRNVPLVKAKPSKYTFLDKFKSAPRISRYNEASLHHSIDRLNSIERNMVQLDDVSDDGSEIYRYSLKSGDILVQSSKNEAVVKSNQELPKQEQELSKQGQELPKLKQELSKQEGELSKQELELPKQEFPKQSEEVPITLNTLKRTYKSLGSLDFLDDEDEQGGDSYFQNNSSTNNFASDYEPQISNEEGQRRVSGLHMSFRTFGKTRRSLGEVRSSFDTFEPIRKAKSSFSAEAFDPQVKLEENNDVNTIAKSTFVSKIFYPHEKLDVHDTVTLADDWKLEKNVLGKADGYSNTENINQQYPNAEEVDGIHERTGTTCKDVAPPEFGLDFKFHNPIPLEEYPRVDESNYRLDVQCDEDKIFLSSNANEENVRSLNHEEMEFLESLQNSEDVNPKSPFIEEDTIVRSSLWKNELDIEDTIAVGTNEENVESLNAEEMDPLQKYEYVVCPKSSFIEEDMLQGSCQRDHELSSQTNEVDAKLITQTTDFGIDCNNEDNYNSQGSSEGGLNTGLLNAEELKFLETLKQSEDFMRPKSAFTEEDFKWMEYARQRSSKWENQDIEELDSHSIEADDVEATAKVDYDEIFNGFCEKMNISDEVTESEFSSFRCNYREVLKSLKSKFSEDRFSSSPISPDSSNVDATLPNYPEDSLLYTPAPRKSLEAIYANISGQLVMKSPQPLPRRRSADRNSTSMELGTNYELPKEQISILSRGYRGESHYKDNLKDLHVNKNMFVGKKEMEDDLDRPKYDLALHPKEKLSILNGDYQGKLEENLHVSENMVSNEDDLDVTYLDLDEYENANNFARLLQEDVNIMNKADDNSRNCSAVQTNIEDRVGFLNKEETNVQADENVVERLDQMEACHKDDVNGIKVVKHLEEVVSTLRKHEKLEINLHSNDGKNETLLEEDLSNSQMEICLGEATKVETNFEDVVIATNRNKYFVSEATNLLSRCDIEKSNDVKLSPRKDLLKIMENETKKSETIPNEAPVVIKANTVEVTPSEIPLESKPGKDMGAMHKLGKINAEDDTNSSVASIGEPPMTQVNISADNLVTGSQHTSDETESGSDYSSEYANLLKKPEDRVFENLSPIKEKRDFFTFTVLGANTESPKSTSSVTSSDKVSTLKKRFEEPKTIEHHPQQQQQEAGKDALDCGPTFHSLATRGNKLKPPAPVALNEYDSEIKMEEKVLAVDQSDASSAETKTSCVDVKPMKSGNLVNIGNSRESFEMAKKMFENKGK